MSADKHNKDKPQVGYIHPNTMSQAALAHMAGAVKYSKWNYLKGHSETELLEAIIRHAQAALWDSPNDRDATSRLGQSVTHLGCILANCNMLITQESLGTIKHDAPHRIKGSLSVSNETTDKET